jgi:hypothetical protein
VYALQDAGFPAENFSELQSVRDDVVGELNNIADETEGKLENMPQGLQDGQTGETLRGRAECLRDVASNLEGIDIPDDPDEVVFEEVSAEEWTVKQGEAEVGKIMKKKANWIWQPTDAKLKDCEKYGDLENAKEAAKQELTEAAEDGRTLDDVRNELDQALDDIACD